MITIVVLFILAGVSINFIFGNEGILSRAQTAVEKYQNAQEEESVYIENIKNEMGKYSLSSSRLSSQEYAQLKQEIINELRNEKEYGYFQMPTDTTLTSTTEVKLAFNSRISGNITYDSTNSTINLKGGKKYFISLTLAANNGGCLFRLKNNTLDQIIGYEAWDTAIKISSGDGPLPVMQCVYEPTLDSTISVYGNRVAYTDSVTIRRRI